MKLLAQLTCGILALWISPCHATNSPRPNVLYIISDDQAWTDFGFMGNSRVHTPNLDALAAKSLTFPNGCLNCSVCRPSLATLLTGLYQHQHLIHFNHGPPGNQGYNALTSPQVYAEKRKKEFDLIQAVPTLPRLLRDQAGYRCLQTGKFWEGHWRNAGFTEGMTTFTTPPESQKFGGVRTLKEGSRVPHGNGDHGLLIGRETLQPIEDHLRDCEANRTQWFIWYAPYLPHQPQDSPQAFYDLAAQRPGVQAHELPYFASIAQFDHSVGELLKLVEEFSDFEQTLIVFVCDNGWSPSKKANPKRPTEYLHTRESKRAPFDQGVRSPILLRWDTHLTPERRHDLVSSVDLLPTLIDLLNLKDLALPGNSVLVPHPQDTAVFGAIHPGDAKLLGNPAAHVSYRWVRQGAWKLIVPSATESSSTPALYQVSEDPFEQMNLYRKPQHQDKAKQLSALLDNWWNPSP